ncbi:MAG TPA: DUF6152 family protein [Steroidobacteraceae bacterium]|jgi:hypothetical protein
MLNRLSGLSAVAALAFVLALAVAPAAWSHHSQSEFDSKLVVEVEGKVTQLDWRSPHARLYIDVVNDKGGVVNWNFELPSPVTLMRRGWKRDSLKVGEVVKVKGARARNFPTIAYANVIRDANGKALFTGTTAVIDPGTAEKAAE